MCPFSPIVYLWPLSLLLFPSLDYCEVVGRPEAQIVRIVNVEQWRLARSPCGSLSMDEIM